MICTKFLIHFFLRALIILNSLILILFLYTYQSNQPPSYSLLAFTCSNSEMGSESTERRQLAGSINTLGESFKVPTLSALCLNIEQKAKLFTVWSWHWCHLARGLVFRYLIWYILDSILHALKLYTRTYFYKKTLGTFQPSLKRRYMAQCAN